MAYPEQVTTRRLRLIRPRPDDLPDWERIWTDADVLAALRPGGTTDPRAAAADGHRRQLEHWERHGFGIWKASERSGGEVAGWVGAWHPDLVPGLRGEIELAWTLRRPFRRRGLAAEGARAAAAAAFAELSPPRLISLILPTNRASIAVAERLGMRPAADEATRQGLVLRVYELPAPSSSRGASPHSTSSR